MAVSLVNRMIRAIRLDVSLYEEVEEDDDALHQAITVVAISRLCSGLGSLIRSLFIRGVSFGFIGGLTSSLLDALVGVVLALVGWSIWSFLVFAIGTRFFKGPETQADYGSLLRAIGFSSSPGILNLLSFLPFMSLLTGIWELAAMIVAVRQALDFETMKSILTCSVGWVVYAVALTLVDILIALPFFR